MTGSAGNITHDYRYDAFGNQLQMTTDTNPFRYCGEYTDAETGYIYLRARYYDPSSGRFISKDPVKDGNNWYAYAANNPVMFIDPSGLDLILHGTGDEVQSIWQNVKKLTDDTLVLTQLEEDGKLTDRYKVTIEKEGDNGRSVGTNMLRRIIGNVYTCSVSVTEHGSGANPIVLEHASDPSKGTGGKIYFNPNDSVPVLTYYKNSDKTHMADIPKEIELGHEFIHVLRYMGGNHKPYDDNTKMNYGTYGYVDEKGNYQQATYRMEELNTTGISYQTNAGVWVDADNWVTSENTLRDENGYGRRAKY